MGLEPRGTGRFYYYLKIRVGDRVLSKYAASGDVAVLMARMDQITREKEAGERREWRRAERAAIEGWVAEERGAADVFRRVEAVFVRFMSAAGYHRPDRCHWWRRTVNPVTVATDREAEVLSKLDDGETALVPEFRKILDYRDDWHKWGDIAWHALNAAIERFEAKNPAVEQVLRRKLAELRAELEGEHPTPIERMLVDRVVHCWYVVNHFEHAYAVKYPTLTPKQDDCHQRRIGQAHRRFLQSLKALADVRRLGLPAMAIQVNNQVNIGNTATSPAERPASHGAIESTSGA
jgi:hypothetical protein